MNRIVRGCGSMLPVVAVAMAIAVTFPSLLLCDPNLDECYQALSCARWREAPMAPLSFYIGHLWISAFGNSLLALRILQLLCQMAAVGIGTWYFLRRTRNIPAASLVFMTLASASQITSMYIYNWDTGAYFWTTLCFLSALLYLRRGTVGAGTLLGVATALMVASRVPLAVLLPVVAVAVVRGRRSRWAPWVSLGSFIVSAAVLVWLIYGSWCGLMDAWSPDNVITGHTDPVIFLRGLATTVPRLVMEQLLPLVCIGGAWIALRRGRGVLAAVCASAVLVGLSMLYILPVRVFWGVWIPVVLMLCFKGRRVEGAHTWLLLCFCVAPAVGSDHLAERLLMLPLIPVALAWAWTEVRRYTVPFCTAMFSAIVVMSAAKYVYWVHEGACDASALNPRLAGLYVSREFYGEVETLRADAVKAEAPGRGFVFAGRDKYVGAYCISDSALYSLQHFHYLDPAADLAFMAPRLRRRAVVVARGMYADPAEDSLLLTGLGYKRSGPAVWQARE